MFCRNCGYQNPEQHGFCGMCGNKLAPVAGKVASPERAADASRLVASAPSSSLPRPIDQEPAVAVAEAARRSAKRGENGREDEITIGGPSFLGLSGTGTGKAGDYSYLFEDEESSHVSGWILLVLLLILAGLLYTRWQPIRNYLLSTALSHSRPQPQPAQDAKIDQPSTSAAAAPASPGNDATPPAAITESKPEQNQAAQPETSQPGTQSPATSKPGDSPKPAALPAGSEPAAEAPSQPPPANSPASSIKRAGRAREETPAAERRAPASPVNAGDELVNSGEKYLYARGVARNCARALSYFNAAAAQQNPQAFSHLGALYATGECVPVDRAAAYAWFRRAYAREPGNRYFERNLTMLWREMTPAERQRATGSH